MNAANQQLEKESGEIDRALKLFKKERKTAVSRQMSALDKYDEEMKEIGDLDDIDRELNMMEAQQRGVDHNIIRHVNQTLSADDNFDDEDYYNDEFGEDQKEFKEQKPVLLAKKVIPNNEVKQDMRVALFGFLEASQNDEDELEMIYERAKEEGGKVADLAAENLFETQKANLSALLRMLDGYHPRQSGNQWSRDPDYVKLLKKLNTQGSS